MKIEDVHCVLNHLDTGKTLLTVVYLTSDGLIRTDLDVYPDVDTARMVAERVVGYTLSALGIAS